MSVNIKIPQFLQHLTGNVKVADVNGSTVGGCLRDLAKRFPPIEQLLFDKDGKVLAQVDIFVNGESIYPEELSKPVNAGDELYIMFVISGG